MWGKQADRLRKSRCDLVQYSWGDCVECGESFFVFFFGLCVCVVGYEMEYGTWTGLELTQGKEQARSGRVEGSGTMERC